ncbi:MAG: ExeA family protein [Micromonosporaceae bacterium]
MIEKLKSHYGFTRTPFGRALAPQMLHRHGAHAEAVARIGWCIGERGLGVVTGEVGAGKTVAVRAALADLDTSRHTTIYLGNPAVGGRGLYGCIVTALGGTPRFYKAALIPQTTDMLAAEEHERGRTTILVLDEAHLLAADQLEELRLLTNADMDSHSPFACLLLGQPTLRRRIKLGTFAALDQRITLRYAMNGMTGTETAGYIAHHLALAGRSDTLFSDDATALIHQVSRGLPRAVNNLAVQALVAAYSANKTIVDESSARAAVAEVTAE